MSSAWRGRVNGPAYRAELIAAGRLVPDQLTPCSGHGQPVLRQDAAGLRAAWYRAGHPEPDEQALRKAWVAELPGARNLPDEDVYR